MKNTLSIFILLLADICSILVSIYISTSLYPFQIDPLTISSQYPLWDYINLKLIYGMILIVMFFEGVYTDRLDFWQENKIIARSLIISFLLLLTVLSLQQESDEYPKITIILTFLFLLFIIPTEKFILKRWLYRIKLWRRSAYVVGSDPLLEFDVFGNPYLGYVKDKKRNAKTLFIVSNSHLNDLEKLLDSGVKHNQEIIFVPILNSYDFSNSHIIHLFNARTNLVVLKNKLLSRSNQIFKGVIDYLLSLILLIPILFVMIPIFIAIKREEPNRRVWFSQIRMGRDGKPFLCYKFRTMYDDADEMLKDYLKNHPEEISYYETFHKYQNDPRITKIGDFLRKTSLDELPQILNVLRGEMSLIGPRPYMISERHKMGEKRTHILAVKPGVTGLWQILGRSDLDFKYRLELDTWYVRNWNLWIDFVIFIKTIKVVLKQEGAR